MNSLQKISCVVIGWLNKEQRRKPGWSTTDWEQFKRVCRVYGVAPLLHEKIEGANSWFPPAIKDWLRQQYAMNQRRVARIQAELTDILVLSAQQNLTIMPLKGAVLTTRYYANPGLRPMADLDLLVHPDDLPTATSVLEHLGYAKNIVHRKHIDFIKPDNRRVVSTEFEHPDNPRRVELHLRVRESFGGPAIDLTGFLWRESKSEKLLGVTACLPSPDALRLHLLVHATYHLWQGRGRLIQLVDLNYLPRLENPDMLLCLDARFVYPALSMQARLFPGAVDAALLQEIATGVSAGFRRWADTLDPVNSSWLNPQSPGLYLTRAIRFAGGRPAEVMQALRTALLPGLDEISLDHPRLAQSAAPWLAYFLLPLDWFKRLRPR